MNNQKKKVVVCHCEVFANQSSYIKDVLSLFHDSSNTRHEWFISQKDKKWKKPFKLRFLLNVRLLASH